MRNLALILLGYAAYVAFISAFCWVLSMCPALCVPFLIWWVSRPPIRRRR